MLPQPQDIPTKGGAQRARGVAHSRPTEMEQTAAKEEGREQQHGTQDTRDNSDKGERLREGIEERSPKLVHPFVGKPEDHTT